MPTQASTSNNRSPGEYFISLPDTLIRDVRLSCYDFKANKQITSDEILEKRLLFCKSLWLSNARKGYVDQTTDGFKNMHSKILEATYGKNVYMPQVIGPLVKAGIIVENSCYEKGKFSKSYKLATERYVKRQNVTLSEYGDDDFDDFLGLPYTSVECVKINTPAGKAIMDAAEKAKNRFSKIDLDWARRNDPTVLTEWKHVRAAQKKFLTDYSNVPGVLGVDTYFSAGGRHGRIYTTASGLSKKLRDYWVCPYTGNALIRVDLKNAWATFCWYMFQMEYINATESFNHLEGCTDSCSSSSSSINALNTLSNIPFINYNSPGNPPGAPYVTDPSHSKPLIQTDSLCPVSSQPNSRPLIMFPSYPLGKQGSIIKDQFRKFICSDPSVTRISYKAVKDWIQANLGPGFLKWLEANRRDQNNPLWLRCENMETELFRKHVYPNIPEDIYWHSEHDGFASDLTDLQIKELMDQAISKVCPIATYVITPPKHDLIANSLISEPNVILNQNEPHHPQHSAHSKAFGNNPREVMLLYELHLII